MPLKDVAQERCMDCLTALAQDSVEQETLKEAESEVYTLIKVHPVIVDPSKAYIEFSM
jgi:hypothetical protein